MNRLHFIQKAFTLGICPVVMGNIYGNTSSDEANETLSFTENQPNELHCECTKAIHQSVFEAALGEKVHIEILESLRCGGKTCHFLIKV